jgi:hypothetical protein
MSVCPLKQPVSVGGAIRASIKTDCSPQCAWYVLDKGCAIAVIAAALSDQKKL